MPKSIKRRTNVIAQLLIIAIFSIWGFASFSGAKAVAKTTTPTSNSVNVNLTDGISIRVLDDTATTSLSDLSFDFLPTNGGVSNTKMAVVEVGTSNETGYTLYMHSDWNNHDGDKTTSLVHIADEVDDNIPSRLGDTYPFWYYHNTLLDADKVIPAHDRLDQLAISQKAVDADRTAVPITVGVDTSVASGVYQNKLVFTATSNPLTTDYELKFDMNTEDAVTNMPEAMTATVTAQSFTFTLPEDKPTRNGYGFAGWASRADASEAEYQPGEEFTIIDSDAEGSSRMLYAVWRAPKTYRIRYYPNGGTGEYYVSESITSTDYPVKALLGSQNFSRSGYGFVGWNTAANGTGKMYGPNELAELEISGTSINLYAPWIASAGNIQNWTGCSKLAQGSVTALKDTRDNQVYAVAKLADGKCWMIENLRYMGAGNSTDTWEDDDTKKQYNYSHITGSWPTKSRVIYQYGAYYSWTAAIDDANSHTIRYGNPDSLTGSVQGVCPVGWRLPRSYYNKTEENDDADFPALGKALGGTYKTASLESWFKYPNNFVLSGYKAQPAGFVDHFSFSSYYNGNYWSSTNNYEDSSRDYAYYLHMSVKFDGSSTTVSINTRTPVERKRYGLAVRCIKT